MSVQMSSSRSCYVDGELKQTLTLNNNFKAFKEKHNMVIGGDHRNGNATYFTGRIESIALWSDVRTASEIKNDFKKGYTSLY